MLLTLLQWLNAFADAGLVNLQAFVRFNPGALTVGFLVLALVTLPLFVAGMSRPQSARPASCHRSTTVPDFRDSGRPREARRAPRAAQRRGPRRACAG